MGSFWHAGKAKTTKKNYAKNNIAFSQNMANLQLPLNQNHETVLGSEYCSGYMDALGKWNTGFYCPNSDESNDVFCCGTELHKYCCTKKDKVIQSEVQDLTVYVGIVLGAAAALLIITLVSCFCCSCCFLYKKRHPSSTSMYRLHNTSEHGSGVTNMYSISNAASRAATPLQIGGSDHLVLLTNTGGGNGNTMGGDRHHHHHHHQQQQQLLLEDRIHPNGDLIGLSHSHTLPHNLSHHMKAYCGENPDIINHQSIMREYGTLGRMPREQPPPYQDFLGGNPEDGHQQILIRPGHDEPVVSISQALSNESQAQQIPHQQQPLQPMVFTTTASVVDPIPGDNPQLFHSTKF